jgi:hypothetical protein
VERKLERNAMDRTNSYARLVCAALFLAGACAAAAGSDPAKVVVHAAAAGETPFPEYELRVGDHDVPVYAARTLDPPFAGKQWDFGGPYGFA